MHWLICAVTVVVLALVSHNVDAQDLGLGPNFHHHLELRTLGQEQKSFSWGEGINNKMISLGEHVIAPNDTYSSIIEQYGLRADPNSILLYRHLNKYHYPVRVLIPGETLPIVIGNQPLKVALDTDLKQQIESREKRLRDQRDELGPWVQGQNANRDAMRWQNLHHEIISAVQQLRTTGYALDRANLEALTEALGIVENITREAINSNRQPTKEELSYKSKIFERLRSLFSAAKNTNGTKVNVYVKTITRGTEKEKGGLNVCFKPAIAWDNFRVSNPEAMPNWRCDTVFDRPSSPAWKLFSPDLEYIIWAVSGSIQTASVATRVSDYREVKIEPGCQIRTEPNQFDSYCSYLDVITVAPE